MVAHDFTTVWLRLMNASAERIALPDFEEGYREVILTTESGVADRVHLLGTREIHAINAAIIAGRPLLVRGEPGIGKSQLARAAAKELGRAYVKYVVDSRTESRDLMWTFDAVKRLADAQVAGALVEDARQVRAVLDVQNYVLPGPLWWVFNPDDAARQSRLAGGQRPSQPDQGDWARGCVLLLDEIDKAESEVPNGLLEALGGREFTPLGMARPVQFVGPAPLVVITTNEERALPDAFLRRCFVLSMTLPRDEGGLTAFLIERGAVHFPGADSSLLREAARLLWVERKTAIEARVTARPGQAEYLDLLRAVVGLAGKDVTRQMAMLREVSEFTLRKHVTDEDDTR